MSSRSSRSSDWLRRHVLDVSRDHRALSREHDAHLVAVRRDQHALARSRVQTRDMRLELSARFVRLVRLVHLPSLLLLQACACTPFFGYASDAGSVFRAARAIAHAYL
jgi:hypothetical protein